MRLPKWLLLQTTKMGTICSKKKAKAFFFCYAILQNGPTGISKGEKLANVVKMLPKLGFTDKRKIPNRCFTTIWDSF